MSDSILDRLTNEPSPLIDRNSVTFVWKGRSAPDLVGDITGWEEGQPIKLHKDGKNFWTYRFDFPSDAYIEYGFTKDGETLPDPFNPRQTSNGVGGYNNWFSMPAYKPSELDRSLPQVPHGMISKHSLPTDYLIFGDRRVVHLYQPPTTGPVPLLVVWDGQDYFKRVHLHYIVDNLIAQKRIRPIAIAFVNNGGQKTRVLEYSCNEATLAWLKAEVLPLAKRELNLLDIDSHPGAFGVLGASMGGLMSVYTGIRLPSIFGYVLSQSGAFSTGGMDMVVFDLLANLSSRPLKFWIDVGRYDLVGLLDSNRRMKNLLVQRGYPLTYREYHAGHNYPAWKDEIWRALEALYGIT